jgi:hypothetical protein
MCEWNQLNNVEQVYLWWEYNAANPDDPISFSDFDEMMQGFTF